MKNLASLALLIYLSVFTHLSASHAAATEENANHQRKLKIIDKLNDGWTNAWKGSTRLHSQELYNLILHSSNLTSVQTEILEDITSDKNLDKLTRDDSSIPLIIVVLFNSSHVTEAHRKIMSLFMDSLHVCELQPLAIQLLSLESISEAKVTKVKFALQKYLNRSYDCSTTQKSVIDLMEILSEREI